MRFRVFTLLVFIPILILSSIVSSRQGIIDNADDPNPTTSISTQENTIDNAIPITSGEYRNQLSNNNTVDYYTFTMTSNAIVEIAVNFEQLNLAIVEIVDYNEQLIATSPHSSFGVAFSSVLETGDYYLKIARNQGQGIYYLDFKIQKQNDANLGRDAGDIINLADTISLGEYQGYIGGYDDADFYEIPITKNYFYMISVITQTKDVATIHGYDYEGNLLHSKSHNEFGSSFVFIAEYSGIYYIKVDHVTNYGEYSLTLTSTESNDLGSGNDAGDTIFDPMSISPDTYNAYIGLEDTDDYYSILVPSDNLITATILTENSATVSFTLVDSTGTIVSSQADNGFGDILSYFVQSEEIIYLHIQSIGTGSTYYLDVELSEQNDAGLQIDAPEILMDASEISEGVFQGLLGYGDSIDMYKFNISDASTPYIQLFAESGRVDLQIYDATGTTISSIYATGNDNGYGDAIRFSAPNTNGDFYYLEVSGFGNYYFELVLNGIAFISSDPNDTILTATELTDGTFYQNVASDGDVTDFYKFTSVENQLMIINVDPASTLRIGIDLYDASGNVISSVSYPSDYGDAYKGYSSTISFFSRDSTNYYLRIQAEYYRTKPLSTVYTHHTSGTYYLNVMNVSKNEAQTETEAPESILQADSVDLGTHMGWVGSSYSDNIDMFRYDLNFTKSRYFAVSVLPSSTLRLKLSIKDQSGNSLYSYAFPSDYGDVYKGYGIHTLLQLPAMNEPIFLEIQAQYYRTKPLSTVYTYHTNGEYLLHLQEFDILEGGSSTEAGSDISSANEMKIGLHKGRTESQHTADYYRFDSNIGTSLRISVVPVASLRLMMRVYDESGTLHWTYQYPKGYGDVYKGYSITVAFKVPTNGTYYIALFGEYYQTKPLSTVYTYHTYGDYFIQVSEYSDASEQSGINLDPENGNFGWVSTETDALDAYSINLEPSSVLHIGIDPYSTLKVKIELLSISGTVLKTLSYPTATDDIYTGYSLSFSYESLNGGEYILQVSALTYRRKISYTVYTYQTFGHYKLFTSISATPQSPDAIFNNPSTFYDGDSVNLSWSVQDNNPKNYSVFANQTLLKAGSWQNTTEISVIFNYSNIGMYEIVLLLTDYDGYYVEYLSVIYIYSTVTPYETIYITDNVTNTIEVNVTSTNIETSVVTNTTVEVSTNIETQTEFITSETTAVETIFEIVTSETTNEVDKTNIHEDTIVQTITEFTDRSNRQRKGISHLAEKLYNEWFINDKMFGTMLFPTSESLKEAASIFSDQLHERKGLSFTDCLILATARHHHISNLLTFESGFQNLISVVQ